MHTEYLAHYGVKGMKWGVRHDRDRSSYTLKKGYQIRRITSKQEAKKGTDLSRNFYASQNQKDFDMYRTRLDDLPGAGAYHKNKQAKRIGLVTLSAVDDVTIAKGEKVLNDILKQYGNTSVSTFFDEFGYGSEREKLGLKEKDSVNKILKSKKYDENTKKLVARQMVGDVLGSQDSTRWYNTGKKVETIENPGKKLLDEYRKQGYDAIEDIEDQLAVGTNTFKPESPLLVINGTKFKIDDKRTVKRKKLAN